MGIGWCPLEKGKILCTTSGVIAIRAFLSGGEGTRRHTTDQSILLPHLLGLWGQSPLLFLVLPWASAAAWPVDEETTCVVACHKEARYSLIVWPNLALKARVARDMSPKPERATSVLIGSFEVRRARRRRSSRWAAVSSRSVCP